MHTSLQAEKGPFRLTHTADGNILLLHLHASDDSSKGNRANEDKVLWSTGTSLPLSTSTTQGRTTRLTLTQEGELLLLVVPCTDPSRGADVTAPPLHPTTDQEVLWKAGTAGKGGNLLRLEDDGNLALIRTGHGTVWETGTSVRKATSSGTSNGLSSWIPK